MTNYKVRFLQEDDRVQRAFEMPFEGDDDAVLHTALQSHPYAVEVWAGSRQVRRFRPGDLAD